MYYVTLICFPLLIAGGGVITGLTISQNTTGLVGFFVLIMGGCLGLWKLASTSLRRSETRTQAQIKAGFEASNACIKRLEDKNDRHHSKIFDTLETQGSGLASINARCEERGQRLDRLESSQD